MLEASSLLLKPSGQEPAARFCEIVDSETQELLGFTVRQPRDRRLWPWSARALLAVHEAEDEPLLFTIHRQWGLRTALEVRDADGWRVGTIRAGWIWDRYGQYFARIAASRIALVFHGANGAALGTMMPSDEGSTLTFDATLQENPFSKMLLLAATLTNSSFQAQGLRPPS